MNVSEVGLGHGVLPEQGSLFWVLGGVPVRKLVPPCVECIRFLAGLTEEESAALIGRAKKQAAALELKENAPPE